MTPVTHPTQGRGVVTATGMGTRIGRIAQLIAGEAGKSSMNSIGTLGLPLVYPSKMVISWDINADIMVYH